MGHSERAMRSLILAAVVGVLLVGATDDQTAAINRFAAYALSPTGITTDQLSTLYSSLLSQVIQYASADSIEQSMITAGLQVLQTQQYITAMGVYKQACSASYFGSCDNVNTTITECVNGAKPIIVKLYKKLWNKKLNCKANAAASSSTKTSLAAKFINKKFTAQRATQVANACKNAMSATDFATGKSLLTSYIDFNRLGI